MREQGPVISICFPTYNRFQVFRKNFEAAVKQVEELEGKNRVEIVVSVNPSGDGREEMSHDALQMAKLHQICVLINEHNIGANPNIIKALLAASGKYVWVIGDDDLILPGVIERVLNVLHEYPDTAWIFLNEALLAGPAEEETAKMAFVRRYHGRGGYFAAGKRKIIRMHKKIDGGILFSTSNIYLRSSVEKVLKHYPKDNMCNQLTFAFESAAHGGAYIITDPCILAGGEITWKKQRDQVTYQFYNEALLLTAGWGYSYREMKALVRYRMCHASLFLWFGMFLLICKGDPLGRQSYGNMLKLLPVTTIFITIASPILAVYLFLRSGYRRWKRGREIRRYPSEEGAVPEIVMHCERNSS